MNTEHEFADTNRHLVEVPDTFAIARWPRDADVATIARCILGTLKYEPHTADTTALRRALESVIDHAQRASSAPACHRSGPGWRGRRNISWSAIGPGHGPCIKRLNPVIERRSVMTDEEKSIMAALTLLEFDAMARGASRSTTFL